MAEPTPTSRLPQSRSGSAWPAQGAWTYQDYRRLPDDGRRYEVIRGELFVTPAPSIDHQRTVMRLAWKLQSIVTAQRLGEVFAAPLDVLLPDGIATPVQPDIVYFRAGNEPQAGETNFQGVPDLVVEVLSPRNWRYDTTTKLAAYRDAGIPEIWFVDPQTRTITVHNPAGAEISRGGPGETVASRLLPGFSVAVDEIFAGR